MHTELKEWLVTVVPPRRAELVEEAFIAMVSLSDHQLDEIALNLANDIDKEDTFVMLNRLNSDLIRYPEEVLAMYGIFLDIDACTQETLPQIVAIMQTVLAVDVWDEADELLGLYDEFSTTKEIFAEMCHVVTQVAPEDILPLLLRVEESFMTALNIELNRLKRVQKLLSEDTDEKLNNLKVADLLEGLPEDSPVAQYIQITGRTEVPWNQLAEVKEALVDLPISDTLVLNWYTLARMAGMTSAKSIMSIILMELESIDPDNINYHIEFKKRLEKIIVGDTNAEH